MSIQDIYAIIDAQKAGLLSEEDATAAVKTILKGRGIL